MKLTAKQARFVEAYVTCLNGTQAAIAAGYSEKTARAIASENLGKPSIQAAIANQRRLREARLSAELDYVLREFVKIADFDLAKLFDKNGCVLPMSQWPPEAATVVASVEYAPVRGAPGRMRASLKLHDRIKALERIGEMVGAFNRRRNVRRKRSAP
jgi:phage terminase small subunit